MKNAAAIIDLLNARGETVSVAESCTGGMVASALVDIPGASSCFCEGYVTYSNEAKEKNLGVDHNILTQHGAVSKETAEEMARGVRLRAAATYGIATTGIAGPGGGTSDKPVGLVYISCANEKMNRTIRCEFSGDRTAIRSQAAQKALELLLSVMTESEAS